MRVVDHNDVGTIVKIRMLVAAEVELASHVVAADTIGIHVLSAPFKESFLDTNLNVTDDG